MRPILYSFRRCPYAMRARMALVVAGQSAELREVALKAKPPELIAASPKATVPVLVLPGGGVIDESLDIIRWALGQADPEGWLAADAAETEAMIAANDGPFKYHLDRTKYPGRYGSGDPEAHRSAAIALLCPLEARLDRSGFLCGDRLTLTDVALFPFIRQFARSDEARFASDGLPNLSRWLATGEASALFAAAMVKTHPWQAGDEMIIFPQKPLAHGSAWPQ